MVCILVQNDIVQCQVLEQMRVISHRTAVALSQTSRNSSTNRRAPLTRRTLEASDPVHGDGTIPGTEVTTLTQRLIRKLPLATRERAIVLKSHTQRKHEKLPPHWTGDQPSRGPHWPKESHLNIF
ncbi:UNVERIFIED_CONTAM: hypothetical protein NCL1_23291 [Trichonephila clavipes]